jgi:hypothetical protein
VSNEPADISAAISAADISPADVFHIERCAVYQLGKLNFTFCADNTG